MNEKQKLALSEKLSERRYKAINDFEPIAAQNYDWLLEYAKFRLEWVFERTKYVEEKSQSLLKLVLAISAGSWALFSILIGSSHTLTRWASVFALGALACLVVSGYCSLSASSPSSHVYPRGEDKAVEYINFYKSEEAAKGRLALILGDSSDQERVITIGKGETVQRGIAFAFAAVVLFGGSLFFQVFSPR